MGDLLCVGGPQTYRLLKFVVGPSRLDLIFLSECSVMDSCNGIWCNFANKLAGGGAVINASDCAYEDCLSEAT